MAFTKITDADLQNKGVIGLPDTPGLSTTEMQEKFDEIALDVLAPKHNGLVDELNDSTAAGNMGAINAQGTASTVQAELDNRYPISTVTQLLNNKVDKEPGKSLSTNDFSAAYKYKLDNIEDNANNYVLPKGTQSTIGGVMGDGSTFTIDENGYGHAIGGGGGGTADYNALINKPVVNGVTVSGNKDSEEYGLLRPYIVVTSEAGSTVTISKGTETITATQILGSTTTWEVCPTSYGTWTVSSDLPGADIATSTITIDAVKTYAITVNHITSTITVTYESGATCTCSKGSTVYTATSNPQTFTVRSIGNWVVSVTYDGLTKTQTVPITADSQSESVTVEFADIEVTYGNAFRGTTITCSCGDVVYSKTAPSNANTVSFTIPSTGTWRVSGTVGSDTYNQDVVVSAMTSYSATLQVFNATVTVTFPYSDGASCTITDGVTTLTANTSPMAFNVPNVGTWTATCTIDGVSAPTQSAVITTDGQTETMTFAFGTINLTYDNAFRGLTITCVNGGTTISKTAPISGNTMAFYPPSTGEWIISSTYSGTPYQTSATITSLAIPVSASLQQVPNGKTVTPTDDIQKWLNCAGIFDKVTYTTLADVLADSTTLLALMSDNNAVDYLVRSTTWCGNGQALVPVMTSNTTPSGECSASSSYSGTYPYNAFDNNTSTHWSANSATNGSIIYKFDAPTTITKAKLTKRTLSGYDSASFDCVIKGSNDNNTWVSLTDTFYYKPTVDTVEKPFTDIATYQYFGLFFGSDSGGTDLYPCIGELQFYAPEGITANSTAMTDIGANDYCANTLLADSTWCSAICNSTYFESVLTVKVPTMTSNTTPSGTVIAGTEVSSESYKAYKAFDKNTSTGWQGSVNAGVSSAWLGYEFTSEVQVNKLEITNSNLNNYFVETFKVQGYDGSSWVDIGSTLSNSTTVSQKTAFVIQNSNKYAKYRILILTGVASNNPPIIAELQFYGR